MDLVGASAKESFLAVCICVCVGLATTAYGGGGEGRLHLQLLIPGATENEFLILTTGGNGGDSGQIAKAVVEIVNAMPNPQGITLPTGGQDVIEHFEQGMAEFFQSIDSEYPPQIGAACLLEHNTNRVVLHQGRECFKSFLTSGQYSDLLIEDPKITFQSYGGEPENRCHTASFYQAGAHRLYTRQRSPIDYSYEHRHTHRYVCPPPRPIHFRPVERSTRQSSWVLVAGIIPAGKAIRGHLVRVRATEKLRGRELVETRRIPVNDHTWQQLTCGKPPQSIETVKNLLQKLIEGDPRPPTGPSRIDNSPASTVTSPEPSAQLAKMQIVARPQTNLSPLEHSTPEKLAISAESEPIGHSTSPAQQESRDHHRQSRPLGQESLAGSNDLVARVTGLSIRTTGHDGSEAYIPLVAETAELIMATDQAIYVRMQSQTGATHVLRLWHRGRGRIRSEEAATDSGQRHEQKMIGDILRRPDVRPVPVFLSGFDQLLYRPEHALAGRGECPGVAMAWSSARHLLGVLRRSDGQEQIRYLLKTLEQVIAGLKWLHRRSLSLGRVVGDELWVNSDDDIFLSSFFDIQDMFLFRKLDVFNRPFYADGSADDIYVGLLLANLLVVCTGGDPSPYFTKPCEELLDQLMEDESTPFSKLAKWARQLLRQEIQIYQLQNYLSTLAAEHVDTVSQDPNHANHQQHSMVIDTPAQEKNAVNNGLGPSQKKCPQKDKNSAVPIHDHASLATVLSSFACPICYTLPDPANDQRVPVRLALEDHTVTGSVLCLACSREYIRWSDRDPVKNMRIKTHHTPWAVAHDLTEILSHPLLRHSQK